MKLEFLKTNKEVGSTLFLFFFLSSSHFQILLSSPSHIKLSILKIIIMPLTINKNPKYSPQHNKVEEREK